MAKDKFALVGNGDNGRWDKAKASAQFKTHVRNIAKSYREASPELVAAGRDWYSMAHDHAMRIGQGDAVRGAGVIAAMSPQKDWKTNLDLADSFVKTGRAGHTNDSLSKASRIMAGEDPADVMKTAHKTRNFYKNILDPSDPAPITVDRHAHDIAVNRRFGDKDRGLSSNGRYSHFHDAYTAAANSLGVETPNQVQATTWSHWRGRAD